MPGVPCAGVSLSPSLLVLLSSPSVISIPQHHAVFGNPHPWNAVPSSSSLWNWKAPQPPGSGLVLTKPSFHPGSMMLYRWEVTFVLDLLPILGSLCIYIYFAVLQ